MELKTMEMSPVEMEDTTNDLIFIQSLIKRFNAATVQPLPAGK